jgi:hypothetical protein
MKRRALLAGLTGALAECTTGSVSDSTAETTRKSSGNGTATRTTVPPAETARTTERDDSVPVAEAVFALNYPDRITDIPLTVSMEFRSRQTDDSPARVHVELTNAGSETVTILYPPTGPVQPWLGHDDGDAALCFVPDDREAISVGSDVEKEDLIPEGPSEDGCWRARSAFAILGTAARTTLIPGGSISETYTLVASARNGGCLPDGEYEFTDSVSRKTGPRYESWDWSFSVSR